MADNRMRIIEGDITKLQVDAIVNAANSQLKGGGGVDGAIHRAAGPKLIEACREIGGCPTGEARLTPGFELPATCVIHAVGPVWNGGGKGEDAQLAGCYRHSLELAKEHGCRSVAFPAVSTGVYGFPADRAARIAVSTVAEVLSDDTGSFDAVIFCCFGADSRQAHERAMAELG